MFCAIPFQKSLAINTPSVQTRFLMILKPPERPINAIISATGKSKNEVKSQYFNFEFVGEGNMVIDQLPKYGEKIEEGSTIVIMLG